eukprot:m.27670 g.27670  ORF g.27670 m.27670 type:complete len:235 (-) comp15787_c0_seq2:47-751(-)
MGCRGSQENNTAMENPTNANWTVTEGDAPKEPTEDDNQPTIKASLNCPCPCGDCGGKGKAGPEVQCWHMIWLTGHTKRSDLLPKSLLKSNSASSVGHDDALDEDELEALTVGDEPAWDPSAVAHMQGWVRKKGGGTSGLFGRKNWKNRWFILHADVLRYFKEEITFLNGSNKSLGWVKVDGSCTLTVEPTGKIMHLHTLKRTLTMEPGSIEELNNWKQSISSLIDKRKVELLMF